MRAYNKVYGGQSIESYFYSKMDEYFENYEVVHFDEEIQDKESFKTFFDGDILTQPDFEIGMDHVFSSYAGNVQSVTCKFPMSIETWFEPGERIYLACTNFNIITSENEYIVYVEFFTQYESKYPNSPYKIRRFKLLQKQEWDNGENFTDCTQRLGIYYPGWLN